MVPVTLLEPGVGSVILTDGSSVEQLRLGSLALGTSGELRELGVTLRDDLDQILLPGIVDRGILLEAVLSRHLGEDVFIDECGLLEHHLVGSVDLDNLVGRHLHLLAISGIELHDRSMLHRLGGCSLRIQIYRA